MRWAVAVSAVLLALFTSGCGLIGGGASSMQQGDCLKKSGDDSFDKVGCDATEAGFVVLDRAGSGKAHDKCVDVAGTEYVYYDKGDGAICVGIKGADVAHAVNTAQKGECVTDTSVDDVKKADCGDPSAVYRVLARLDTTSFMSDSKCASVAGTQTSYSYVLKAKEGIGSIGSGVVFCLIAKDSDPTRTVDNAKVGDCLKKSGQNEVVVTPCSSPDADYKILSSQINESFCENVRGSNATYTYSRPGDLPKALCLGSVR